jgi:ABC-2 type transport system permease protein
MTYLRAELLKLGSLPSLGWTVVLTLAATGLLRWAAGTAGTLPLTYTQAGFLILGVLAVASEHEGGGQIRTTLLAMPRRLPLLGAKAVTLALAALPVAVVAALVCGTGARVIGYLVATTLLAGAATSVIRHPVPAVLSLLLVFYVAGPLLRDDLGDWLPGDPGNVGVAVPAWTLGAAVVAVLVFPRRDAA